MYGKDSIVMMSCDRYDEHDMEVIKEHGYQDETSCNYQMIQ